MYPAVTLCTDDHLQSLKTLLRPYGMRIERVPPDTPIPGSYWGDTEAGLIADTLYLRDDTPLHSALHEACHFICMDDQRRGALHTDAGGEFSEENAVCYLQGLLAGRIPNYDRAQIFADMDEWGYTFRLGCAAAWFENDADDARQWLLNHRIIDAQQQPTGIRRS